MDVYDTEAVRAVWQRVQGTPPSDRAYLAALIAEEYKAHRAYCALSAGGGRFSAALRATAAAELHHARTLEALYFLLFGEKPRIAKASCPRCAPLRDALRTCYAAELDSAEAYRQAALRFSAQESLFRRLAQEEQCHAQQIHSVMTRLIEG